MKMSEEDAIKQRDAQRDRELKSIDCPCPSHTIQRAQRELTRALHNLHVEAHKHLPLTNVAMVDARNALELHGYKEKGE